MRRCCHHGAPDSFVSGYRSRYRSRPPPTQLDEEEVRVCPNRRQFVACFCEADHGWPTREPCSRLRAGRSREMGPTAAAAGLSGRDLWRGRCRRKRRLSAFIGVIPAARSRAGRAALSQKKSSDGGDGAVDGPPPQCSDWHFYWLGKARRMVPGTQMASQSASVPTFRIIQQRGSMTKYKLEYIWLDGYTPTPNLRARRRSRKSHRSDARPAPAVGL